VASLRVRLQLEVVREELRRRLGSTFPPEATTQTRSPSAIGIRP